MVTPPPPLKISYPAELPIAAKVDEIAAAIRDHQVVVVAGETGSGKTTQLPKICLQLGRGRDGMIGHTQPRRLAARTVADRIAAELDTRLGGLVGYQVRFTDQVGDQTMVKLMTDGILLAELARDRQLRRYDTLIIDEAHERSLNIDFLLGYLRRLLPRRPDLKVIITSATIDPERLAAHFQDRVDLGVVRPSGDQQNGTPPSSTGGSSAERAGAAPPVVEVSGRTYPVEVRYRPYGLDDDRDQTQAICDAVDELAAVGLGDVLVFLSGEREIRDTADALRRHLQRQGRHEQTEILPLFARLSMAEQHRVFQSHPGRRIVLATNVAETSLTVPGIRYVVDPGTARISRYSHRLKVQRLPIEPISQASATQRAGRCGRVADGVCIRLYSEDDFAGRPEFTEPEILRTNLASVILQMAALGLGDVAGFPFVDPPDHRQIADGVRLLDELGALQTARTGPRDSARGALSGQARIGAQSKGARNGGEGRKLRLTGLGRKLAQLPVDPRLGRMVLAADRDGCLREVCVIAAALSIQDPRERPADRREAADTLHARFADERSDFLAYLNLWHYLQDKQKELSGNQLRRLCRDEHLNYLRVREWQDVHHQLRRVARTLGASLNSQPADPDRVHTALLAGLLSHIGVKDQTSNDPKRRHEYLGARGARFAIAPGSVLFKRSPQCVMVAELVETSRLWGRIAASIQPEWVEPLAAHLVNREYSEPHWERKRGAAVAYEKVTLYGVPIVPRRKVDYGRIDPEQARELFIRHALVEGDWDNHHAFFRHNQELLQQAEELEHRARRRDIVVDDQVLFEFFDRRVGRQVTSAAHFDRWWKQERRNRPQLLNLTMAVLTGAGGAVREEDYPGRWRHGDLELPLTYQFDPGSPTDGVTVHIDLPVLDDAARAGLDWQVPGLRRDLVIALIRSLPKARRRAFVPVPDVADEVLATLQPYAEPLRDALARELSRLAGEPVPPDAFDLARVPDHLRMTYRVVDQHDQTLAEGKDLAALREQLRPAVAAELSAAAVGIERRGLRQWDELLGALPSEVTLERAGRPVTAYPGLVDTGDAVDVRVFTSAAERDLHLRPGLRRLLLLACPSPATYVAQRLSSQAKLALAANPHGGVRQLLDDCAACAADAVVADHGGPSWEAERFAALRKRVRGELAQATLGVVTEVLPVLGLAQELGQRLDSTAGPGTAEAVADLRQQLAGLVRPGFVTATGWERLPDLRRYLEAMRKRLDKLPGNPERDRRAMAEVHEVQQEYQALRAHPPAGASPGDLERLGWMIEELRVSLFAQQLGTRYPVSTKRVFEAIDDLAG